MLFRVKREAETGLLNLIMNYYPIYLNLQGQRCVIIGGGPIAEGKVHGLLQAEAMVTVIAPTITEELQALVAKQLTGMSHQRVSDSASG